MCFNRFNPIVKCHLSDWKQRSSCFLPIIGLQLGRDNWKLLQVSCCCLAFFSFFIGHFFLLPCILSFSIIASQEGEQHKRAQAKTCQMTCKKQWYCHSLQSPCSLHLWPYWMEWKENEMILWYKLRIVLQLNMRCCRSQLTELKADYSPGEENDSTYSLCIVQPCHPVWPIIISDSNGTRSGGDPVPPPRTSHHTQASSCNGSPRHGRATGNQNCCRLIVYLTHYSRSL